MRDSVDTTTNGHQRGQGDKGPYGHPILNADHSLFPPVPQTGVISEGGSVFSGIHTGVGPFH